jgi:peptidoglycan hydrolase-like protein with peptidoglycan-binding domain
MAHQPQPDTEPQTAEKIITSALAGTPTPTSTLTRDQIDQLAAAAAQPAPEAASQPEAPVQAEPPTLAVGATGEHVLNLTNLLKLLGYATSTVVTEGKDTLDETVLADVRAFRTAFGVAEPELEQIKGELIGPATWDALYKAAASELSKIA